MDTELIFIMKYYNLYIVLFYKFVKKNFKKLKKYLLAYNHFLSFFSHLNYVESLYILGRECQKNI